MGMREGKREVPKEPPPAKTDEGEEAEDQEEPEMVSEKVTEYFVKYKN